MRQILHIRNSGASVSDKEAERVQHATKLDECLIATEVYIGVSTGNSSGILAPPPLHE